MRENATALEHRMESLVGLILQVGVITSASLLMIGLAWHWWVTGSLTFHYQIKDLNLFQFVVTDLHLAFTGQFRPRLFLSLGIAALLLTPYIRVLVSVFFFAFVEKNLKYTLFTTFVFAVLTYTLFLH